MSSRRMTILDWALPAVVLIGLTIPFWITDLDVSLAKHFYTPGAGWPRGGEEPWSFLYHYGMAPAWVVALSSLGVFIASFRTPGARRHRRGALFLVLVMATGPGLLTNDVFKEHWGRPRPRDLVEFGGDRAYVKPWVKSPRENGNSFPSGHAATGFFLLTPYFLLRRVSMRRAAGMVVLGLGYGALMGVARMAQGAHFLSDVLWALGFVYLSGLAWFYALRPDRDTPLANSPPSC